LIFLLRDLFLTQRKKRAAAIRPTIALPTAIPAIAPVESPPWCEPPAAALDEVAAAAVDEAVLDVVVASLVAVEL